MKKPRPPMDPGLQERFDARRKMSALTPNLESGYASFDPEFVLMVEPRYDEPLSPETSVLLKPYPALLAQLIFVPQWETTAADGPDPYRWVSHNVPSEDESREPTLAWELTLSHDWTLFASRSDVIPAHRLIDAIYQMVVAEKYVARVRRPEPGEYEACVARDAERLEQARLRTLELVR